MVLSSLSEPAKGRIARVDIGGLPVGGQTALAFHRFEGEVPFLPRMALEVWDTAPEDWPQPLADIYGAVWHDPVAWAEKAVTLGAEMLVLRLMGGGAKGDAKATAETAGVAAAVVEATGIPAVILGPGEPERDAEVGKAVAAALSGKHCFLGMAEEVNHRALGAAALGYGQGVIASSPIDVNLAKQLNVLLSRLGLEESAIIMDPTTGALGYGLEYSYTVFERIRLAALTQNDQKMQVPIIALVGGESWKTKESRAGEAELPGAGDRLTRGVLWEAVTGLTLALAGADILALRHPRSVQLLRTAFDSLSRT
ncbi:MAG: acetyl-CoA decarbonylase/synthase complex subunit delta [Gaiellales bacterium]|nr:acetyl-CoA decarbonylase/synthase complex subunit delta [Gaiellales bacterium]